MICVMLVSIIIFHVSPDQGESLSDQKEELVSIVQNCLKGAHKFCREELRKPRRYKNSYGERYSLCVDDKLKNASRSTALKCQSSYFKTKLFVIAS